MFSTKFSKLTLVSNKKNFIYEEDGLCPARPGQKGNRQLTVRLWKPVGKTKASEIVTAFSNGLSPTKISMPSGFKFYYGAVVKDAAGDELALFANIFASPESRDAFTQLALEFAVSNLKGKAELAEKTAGTTPEPASYYVC